MDTNDILFAVMLTLSIIQALVIVACNSVTIHVIRSSHTLQEKYGILFLSYCCVDILNGFYGVYLQVRVVLYSSGGNFVCSWGYIILHAIDAIPYAITSIHTVLLTLDRYIAICYPLTYQQLLTAKAKAGLLCAAWAITLMENFLPPMYGKYYVCVDNVWPSDDSLLVYVQISHTSSIFLLHTLMYARICWIAHKARNTMVQPHDGRPPRPFLDRGTLSLLVVIILSYIVAVPYAIVRFTLLPTWAVSIGLLILFSGSFINNIIFVVMNRELRQAIAELQFPKLWKQHE